MEALTTHLGHTEILIRLGVAAGIGFLVGLERELKSKNLGLRTNMLVAIGAALFGLIGSEMMAAIAAFLGRDYPVTFERDAESGEFVEVNKPLLEIVNTGGGLVSVTVTR